MDAKCILAYDVGTSGVKTVLIDLKGNVLAQATADYPIFTPSLGWAEQKPDDYWQAIIKSTREALVLCDTAKGQVAALAFSTQSMGIIPIDERGDILYDNITWVDGRATAQAKMINDFVGAEMVGGKDVICKLLWLKGERPDIYDKTKYFMDVNCYLRYKATGLIKTELTGASSYGLDIANLTWNEEIYGAAGIGTGKFPQLIKSTDLVGGLTREAAGALGLLEGTPVYGGCDDVQAAALGAGAMGEGDGHIYLGSSAWLCVTTENLFDMIVNGAATVKSADPKKNVVVGVTQSAGMTVDHAVGMFYKNENCSGNIFDRISEEMGDIPPGSENLIVTPWIFGEYCPITSEAVRMTMFNLTNMHTRAHIMKAIFEGIGYNLRWIKENYKRDFGIELSQLRVIGGGSNNDQWMQILADLMQVKIQTIEDMQYAGARGAAMCALVGLGIYGNFDRAAELIKVKKEFVPKESNFDIYNKLFSEYKGLYSALKDSYERVNA